MKRKVLFIGCVDFSRALLKRILESPRGQDLRSRHEKAIEALACFRGAQAGFPAAEAFMLMRDREIALMNTYI